MARLDSIAAHGSVDGATEWVRSKLAADPAAEALVTPTDSTTYGELRTRVEHWVEELDAEGVEAGAVVAFRGDYSTDTLSLLLALMASRRVAVPLGSVGDTDRLCALAHVDTLVDPTTGEVERVSRADAAPELLTQLRAEGQPGLVVFSSGSSGPPKAVLYDIDVVLSRYQRTGRPYRTLIFLTIDHFGGLNTLFHTLSTGGTSIVCDGRDAKVVCELIQSRKVELLPTTPTFLRMLLISRLHEQFDLSSLSLVTYGTEPMPEQTLRDLIEAMPGVRLKQTYGLSELGVLPTRSRSGDSLWLKVGGIGCEARVVDGILWLRSETAMLGYLNAPSPFDAQGWYCTGDRVDVDGEFMRILGRDNEVINVGGLKVYPNDVEDALLAVSNVAEAVVWGARNAVTGQVVKARVRLVAPEPEVEAAARIRRACAERLSRHERPVDIEITDADMHSSRYKKRRPAGAEAVRAES